MWTIKSLLKMSELLLKIVIVAAAVCAESSPFIKEESVYWFDKSELVFTEYVNIILDVQILSPCDLDAFPPGFNKSQYEVETLRLQWTKKYDKMFLHPLLTEQYHCGHKVRATTPINTEIDNVTVKLALLVGYGSIYSFSSIHGDDDISKMKLGQMANVTEVRRDDLVKMVESKLSEEGSFEDVLELPELKRGFKDWSHYQDLMHSLYRGEWNGKRIPAEFLPFIGIEDFREAFGDVLLHPVGYFNCSVDLNWTNMKITLSLPKVNRDLRLFHAEAFKLTESFQDFICVLKYNGTQNVIWSMEQNCIVAKDVAKARNVLIYTAWEGNVFRTKSNSCIPMPTEFAPYFVVSTCHKRGMWPAEDLFSSKLINQTDYIYCNGGFVNFPTKDDPPTPCPSFVFRTNNSVTVSVNVGQTPTHLTNSSNITVVPATVSQALNTMIFPGLLNTSAIIMSEMSIPRETYVLPPAAIAMFIIMGSVISVMIVALVYVFRKFQKSRQINDDASVKFWKI